MGAGAGAGGRGFNRVCVPEEAHGLTCLKFEVANYAEGVEVMINNKGG